MKLGIIQSRGLGDIVIALPIARYYHDQGWQVHWPICREFLAHLELSVPWVHWHAVTTDQGSFFLEQPQRILEQEGCDLIIPLYQALTGQDYHLETYFQHTKFDQYKYIRAGVPFDHKWRLKDCLVRQPQREAALMDLIKSQLPQPDSDYILVHVQGSDHRARFDTAIIPQGMPCIEITELTYSIFDWLWALEQAWAVILVDSVYSNLVDQLGLQTADSRYFIPRSHIGLTPVLGQHWNWISNQNLGSAAATIRV